MRCPVLSRQGKFSDCIKGSCIWFNRARRECLIWTIHHLLLDAYLRSGRKDTNESK